MADRRGSANRQSGRAIARRAYAPRPVRSRAASIATWLLAGIACATAGAAAMHAYGTRAVAARGSCAVPAAHDDLQDALARAQLALKQEAASRATVQKSADALTVEVTRLQTQVLFLQGQSRSRR